MSPIVEATVPVEMASESPQIDLGDGVMIEAAGGLPVGARVRVSSNGNEAGGLRVVSEAPLGPVLRGPGGPRAALVSFVPGSAVALGYGEVVRGDLDGDGQEDRAWLARAAWGESWDDEPADFEIRLGKDVVIAEIGGQILISPPRHDHGCSGEGMYTLTPKHVTGDRRPELIVTWNGWICEAGGVSSGLTVLVPQDGALRTLAEVEVPRWPMVSTFSVGKIGWRRGAVYTVVVSPGGVGANTVPPEAPLQRVYTRYDFSAGFSANDPPEDHEGPWGLSVRVQERGPVWVRRNGAPGELLRWDGSVGWARFDGAEEEVSIESLAFEDDFVGDELLGSADDLVGPGRLRR